MVDDSSMGTNCLGVRRCKNTKFSNLRTRDNATYNVPGGALTDSIHMMTSGIVCPCTFAIVHKYAGRSGW